MTPNTNTSPQGLTLSSQQVTEAALTIYDAERSREPRGPLIAEYPDMTLADSYAIQNRYAQMRLSQGATQVGRKIGATSKAVQELFGIDTPDYGRIFGDMVATNGDVALGELIQAMIEPEIGFVLAEDLVGPGIGADDVLAATRGVLPCLEVIDSRIANWDIQLFDTIADNGSSARCVLGSEVPVEGIDLISLPVEFSRNGEVIARATGEAALGNPAAAIAWLANAIGEFGSTLRAGEIILSGSLTTAVRVSAGESYSASFPTLGTVACRFT